MVQRNQAVGFAAAKAGSGLDDGVAALAVAAADSRNQQIADAAGNVSAAEKLQRVAVHRRGGAVINLLQVGGKVGLPERPLGHIRLGRHRLMPRRRRSPARMSSACCADAGQLMPAKVSLMRYRAISTWSTARSRPLVSCASLLRKSRIIRSRLRTVVASWNRCRNRSLQLRSTRLGIKPIWMARGAPPPPAPGRQNPTPADPSASRQRPAPNASRVSAAARGR